MSPGFGRGAAFVFGATQLAVPHRRIAATAIGDERRRLEGALRLGAEDVARLQGHVKAELGETEAEIFDAHLGLLNDPHLVERIAHAPFDLWDREHRHGVKLYDSKHNQQIATIHSCPNRKYRAQPR